MKEKVAVFTEKCECSDLFTIAENKYRTESSLYKDKKIVQEAGLEPARYCYHRHLKPARLPIPPLLHFNQSLILCSSRLLDYNNLFPSESQ